LGVIAFSGEAEVLGVKSLLNVQLDIEHFSRGKKSYHIFLSGILAGGNSLCHFLFSLKFPTNLFLS